MEKHRDEVDFLLEQEYALGAQLERIRGRIGFLLEKSGVDTPEPKAPRHLTVVREEEI